MKPKLLVIDDNQGFLDDLSLLMSDHFIMHSTPEPEIGLGMITDFNPDLILLDLMLGNGVSGLDVLDRIKQIDAALPVIMITDHGSIDTAVKAVSKGAVNYISKTPNVKELVAYINKALGQRSLELQSRSLFEESGKGYNRIIGASEATRKLIETIKLVAASDTSVLITGESGTGKELVARQIHQNSSRSGNVFLSMNCAAIPGDLLESELFGHEKGAFTGASARKLGKFEVASDGILFFDEVSELSQESQVKLLRVLQEKEFTRLGSNAAIQTGARILAATNGNLADLMESGQFRSDLYYRLDVLRIDVPPLRERKGDIALLADHFISAVCRDMKIPVKSAPIEFLNALEDYSWPGNIRELRNYITRAVIHSPGERIDSAILETSPLSMEKSRTKLTLETLEDLDNARRDAAEDARRRVEREFLSGVLKNFGGNVSEAARSLGINRTNLHKMITRSGIKV